MTTTVLAPYLTQQFLDSSGAPLVGGLVYSYQAGTNTPTPTWVDSTGVVQNTNPIMLNARGECSIWVLPNVSIKYVLTDAANNPIWTRDNVVQSQLISLYGGVDVGNTNAYVINFAAPFTSYTDGIAIYWIPSHSNTGPSTINVNGLGVVPIVNQDGSALATHQLTANQIAFILSIGGKFVLSSIVGAGGVVSASSLTVTGAVSVGTTLTVTGMSTLTGGFTVPVADNFARGVALVRYMSALETRVNSSTAVNSTQLTLALAGAGTYAIRAVIFCNNGGSATTGASLGINYSGTYIANSSAVNVNAPGTINGSNITAAASNLAVGNTAAATAANPQTGYIDGVLTATGAGTLSISFAQSANNATVETFMIGSWMMVTQLT